jgi:hypothetical protein
MLFNKKIHQYTIANLSMLEYLSGKYTLPIVKDFNNSVPLHVIINLCFIIEHSVDESISFIIFWDEIIN